MPNNFTDLELQGKAYRVGNDVKDVATGQNTLATPTVVETKCHAYEWMTAYVGMIAVQRKQRSTFRNHVATESAAPVVVCAVGRGPLDEVSCRFSHRTSFSHVHLVFGVLTLARFLLGVQFDWQFAGVVRSNSVRTVDDGMGPSVDEYFTLTIAGPQTILNNSKDVIHPGVSLTAHELCAQEHMYSHPHLTHERFSYHHSGSHFLDVLRRGPR